MFKRILVPIDLSDRQGRVLRTACDLASHNHAHVTLLHVIHRVPDIPLGELRSFYGRLVEDAQRQLAQAAKPFAAKGLPVDAEVAIGEPALEIVRLAAAEKIDLLVMGSARSSRDGSRAGGARPATRWGSSAGARSSW